MSGGEHSVVVPTNDNIDPCISDGVNKTLQMFSANANKCLGAKKRRVALLTDGAVDIYKRKLEDVYRVEADAWSACHQSLQRQCDPVLDDLKRKLPSVEKSGQILLKDILQQKALLQDVLNHQNKKLQELRKVIEQFKQNREASAGKHAEAQKRLPGDFRSELINLHQEIMLRNQRDDVENIKSIFKNMFS